MSQSAMQNHNSYTIVWYCICNSLEEIKKNNIEAKKQQQKINVWIFGSWSLG